jgi:dipeptidyl aminopeptidase/acylaminoacyl peptidase
MRRLTIAIALLLSCSAPIAVPSPSSSVTASPTSAPTLSPTPLPSAASGGIEVFATGQLHGTYLWVVEEEFVAPDRISESLFAVPLDGSAPRRALRRLRSRGSVTSGGYNTLAIVPSRQLSPDGTRVLLEQSSLGPAAHDGLVIVDLAKGTISEIARGDQQPDVMPAWSPDGGRIAFARRSTSPGSPDDGLWVVNVDGSSLRRLLAGACCAQLTYVYGWTADGAGVAFAAAFEGANYSLADVSTGAVSGPNGQVFGPAPASWRAKTPQFVGAFSEGDKGGTQRIDVADGIGKPVRTIAQEQSVGPSDPLFLNARWSPTADEILYIRASREAKVFRVNASGGAPVDVGVQGQPFRAEWLPDGRIAVITVSNGVGSVLQVVSGAAQNPIFSFPGGATFTDFVIRTYP